MSSPKRLQKTTVRVIGAKPDEIDLFWRKHSADILRTETSLDTINNKLTNVVYIFRGMETEIIFVVPTEELYPWNKIQENKKNISKVDDPPATNANTYYLEGLFRKKEKAEREIEEQLKEEERMKRAEDEYCVGGACATLPKYNSNILGDDDDLPDHWKQW